MANSIEAAEVVDHDTLIITKTGRPWIAQPIGWSSIFAGAVVAISVWLLLHMFGIGVGLTAIQPDDPSSLKSVGIGTGIWSAIAPIIALFVGGLVVGRVAPTINRLNAAIHGVVVWGITCVLALVVTVMLIAALLRGVSSATSTVVGAAPISQLQHLPGALGLDAKDLVAPVNQRLQAEGMPRVTLDQLQKVIDEAVDTAVRQGGIDRETLTDIAARNTALSRAEAEQIATQVESEMSAATRRGQVLATRAGHTALEAAESAGAAVLWIAVMMLVGLGAAIGGSLVSAVPRAHATARSAP